MSTEMESFLEDLKQQVHCSLCNEIMNEPKLLQCYHTFCKPCIKNHVQLDGQVSKFKCPQCNSEQQELDDVESLKSSPVHSRILKVLSAIENQKVCSVSASHSPAVCKCLQCDCSVCDECQSVHSVQKHEVVKLSDVTKEDIEKMLKRENACAKHTNQDVELYCQDCNMLICTICLKELLHHNHKLTSLQEFVTAKKDSLSKNLQGIKNLSSNEEVKERQEKIALDIKRDAEKAQEEIKKVTKQFIKAITEQEQKLLNDIKECATKAENNERMLCHATAVQEYITRMISYGTASDLIDSQKGECLYPNDSLVFDENKEFSLQVNTGSIGQLRSFKKADPKNTLMAVDYHVEATKTAKLKIMLKTSSGEVVHESLDKLTIQFTPEKNGKVEEMRATAEGQIEVDFTPRIPGVLKVEAQVYGVPIANSPLPVQVKPQLIEEVNELIDLKKALSEDAKKCIGIAVNKSNTRIAISDWEKCWVKVFNLEGGLLMTYGSKGGGEEEEEEEEDEEEEEKQLQGPCGLAFLNETELVIADRDNSRICIIDSNTGTLLRTFGSKGGGEGKFNWPFDVVIDEDSNIIVCDAYNGLVQVFTKEGKFLYQFDTDRRIFSVVKHNGRFYVSNPDGGMIRVFELDDNHSATLVTKFDGEDTEGELSQAWGLALDNDNNLLVCDFSKFTVNKFLLDGTYIGKTKKLANELTHLTVLNDGRIICPVQDNDFVVF